MPVAGAVTDTARMLWDSGGTLVRLLRWAMAGAALVLLALVATISAGCDGDGEPGAPGSPTDAEAAGAGGTTTPTDAASAATTTPTEGITPGGGAAGAACSLGPIAAFPAGRTSAGAITSEGRERTFQLYVPPSYDGTREIALVLNFHGLGSNGAEQQFYSGLVPVAEREGFLVVSPDGINRSWLLTPGVNDITFTRDLVAGIAEFACVDLDRVYATGISNGGFMSAALACFAGDLVAAVAPVAGMTAAGNLCGDPVPFIEFHGTDDRVVPYEPGIVAPTGGSFAGVPALMEAWAEFNGCEGEPREEPVGESVVFREYLGCKAPTGHYVVKGGGHTWPGAVAVDRLGVTTREISATEIAWAFFEANPRK